MLALKNHKKPFAVLAVAIIICAFLFAGYLLYEPRLNGASVGIGVHSLSTGDARLVEASGAKWIRIDVADNLSNFNSSVRSAKAENFSVLGILDSWMFNKSTIFTLEEWRGNVTYYIAEYAEFVDAWEIWNEPASPKYPLLNLELNNSKPDYQENMGKIVDFYYAMAQTAYPIIRQYDPTAKVLLYGGLNLYSGGDQNLDLDKDFSSQLAAKGIEQLGDVISVHAYPWGEIQPQVWQSYTSSLAYYRGLSVNKSFEIWVTETGQPLQNDIGQIDEAEQTQYLHEALNFFQDNAAKTFWYSLLDNADEVEEGKNFGLIGDNFTGRSSYYEMQKLLNR